MLSFAFEELFLLKGVLVEAADGANEIGRNLLPGSAGSDAAFFVAKCGVIDIAAGANILIHRVFSFLYSFGNIPSLINSISQ